jgi:serine-type D-Ala-D-Ala carboxypeptidase/endopeptidase (penicillin-binding protein 4)
MGLFLMGPPIDKPMTYNPMKVNPMRIDKKPILCLSLFTAMILWIILVFFVEAQAAPKEPGILLADDQGKILYSQNRNSAYTPASIFKIFTSLAAMDTFGIGYRFKTLFCYDQASGNLYIKGFGDPLLVSEVINEMTKKIIHQIKAQAQARTIKDIILDNTYFDSHIRIPGTGDSLNPYDATTGALCANFNTVAFKWDPLAGQFISPEPQTPLLPEFLGTIQATGQKQGRILLDPKQRNLYPGLLMKYFLEKKGIPVKGRVKLGPFEGTKEKTGTLESPFTLEQIIQKLLEYSNNFMANQLMLAMGAQRSAAPATLAKGVNALETFANENFGTPELGMPKGTTRLIISEGSGLSRRNQITPGQMLEILFKFLPFHELLKCEDNREYYKTGTLSDVRTRAGFLKGNNNSLYPFVIMVNKKNTGYGQIRQLLMKKVEAVSSK